ncbi:hypothetical protein JOC54_000710, partial [Alkalihalobacillus xiaoxiensis]|nr:hypothetical protein [Shouchella xiaoxiensis]
MSKKTFTEKEINHLSINPYVKTVSSKGITYTNEFKSCFIAEKKKGKFSRQIFEEAGFDVNIIGMTRIHAASKRWSEAYKKNGVMGLTDTRKGHSGRPREREVSLEEKNA